MTLMQRLHSDKTCWKARRLGKIATWRRRGENNKSARKNDESPVLVVGVDWLHNETTPAVSSTSHFPSYVRGGILTKHYESAKN
jgi:hypothetical protein